MDQKQELFAPKIYYFHPLLAGRRSTWAAHLRRCRDLGFDHVLSAPLFAPGKAGNLFLAMDHEFAHPALGPSLPLDQVIDEFAQACRANGLRLCMDVMLGRVAADAAIARSKPDWFRAPAPSDRIDPRSSRRESDAAYARFDQVAVAKELAEWWIHRLLRLIGAGLPGFRCGELQLVPPKIWRQVIATIKHKYPDCRFLAWTPGLDWRAIAALRGLGFDAAFSSVAWWDGRASWFVEEHRLLRDIGSVIGCAEAPFAPRLARRLQKSSDPQTQYRHMLRRAAAASDGIMIPMGWSLQPPAT